MTLDKIDLLQFSLFGRLHKTNNCVLKLFSSEICDIDINTQIDLLFSICISKKLRFQEENKIHIHSSIASLKENTQWGHMQLSGSKCYDKCKVLGSRYEQD